MSDSGTNHFKIALIGNPNSGKSTVFNQLTGLRQKTGNFPGVTVDMKEGRLRFPSGVEATLIDLPGTYSLYPTSSDEKIVTTVLTNPKDGFYPDALVYIADVNHLEKHLLLFTQLRDLGLPILMALNMSDTAAEAGIKVNIARLSERLGVPIVSISGRTGEANHDGIVVELAQFFCRLLHHRRAERYLSVCAECSFSVSNNANNCCGADNRGLCHSKRS